MCKTGGDMTFGHCAPSEDEGGVSVGRCYSLNQSYLPSTQTFFVLSAEDAAYSSYNAAVYLRKSVIGNFIAVMGTTLVVPISFL